MCDALLSMYFRTTGLCCPQEQRPTDPKVNRTRHTHLWASKGALNSERKGQRASISHRGPNPRLHSFRAASEPVSSLSTLCVWISPEGLVKFYPSALRNGGRKQCDVCIQKSRPCDYASESSGSWLLVSSCRHSSGNLKSPILKTSWIDTVLVTRQLNKKKKIPKKWEGERDREVVPPQKKKKKISYFC